MSTAPKTPDAEPKKWIGGLCEDERIHKIDMAAAVVKQSRSEFIVEAAWARTQTVLGSDEAQEAVRLD
jgi:uncharacterized protein (DUF1778 family)